MRMRKKKNFTARMERVSALRIDDPVALRGQWKSLPEKDGQPSAQSLWLELGCGKGSFLNTLAPLHPGTLFIGWDRVPEALLMGLEKALPQQLGNLYFVEADAAMLDACFAPGEIDRLLLHFSDPWPSKKRAKRRLTHRNFLFLYKKALAPDGLLVVKTDNEALFDFSHAEILAVGGQILFETRDWHAHPAYPDGDAQTEYEASFAAQGLPIFRLEARL